MLLHLFDFILEFAQVLPVLGVVVITDGALLEVFERLALQLLDGFTDALFFGWDHLLQFLLDLVVEEVDTALEGLFDLCSLQVLPGCLNDWDAAFVEGFSVGLCKLHELRACDELSFEHLGSHLAVNFALESLQLNYELLPQLQVLELIQVL